MLYVSIRGTTRVSVPHTIYDQTSNSHTILVSEEDATMLKLSNESVLEILTSKEMKELRQSHTNIVKELCPMAIDIPTHDIAFMREIEELHNLHQPPGSPTEHLNKSIARKLRTVARAR